MTPPYKQDDPAILACEALLDGDIGAAVVLARGAVLSRAIRKLTQLMMPSIKVSPMLRAIVMCDRPIRLRIKMHYAPDVYVPLSTPRCKIMRHSDTVLPEDAEMDIDIFDFVSDTYDALRQLKESEFMR